MIGRRGAICGNRSFFQHGPGRRNRRIATFLLWLGAIGSVVFVGTSVAATAAPPAGRSCGANGAAAPLSPSAAGKRQPALTGGSNGFRLRFDDSRTPRMLPVLLQASDPLDPHRDEVNVQLGGDGYLRSSEDRYIASRGDGLVVNARVTPNGSGVEVCLSLDPREARDAGPGSFTGTVTITGDVQPLSLPVVVTFRESREKGLLIAVFGVALGLLAKMCVELSTRGRTGAPRRRRKLSEYPWAGIAAVIIVGAFSGWIGFVEIYDVNRSWGASGTDALKLFATCFGFQMGSIGGIDLVKRVMSGAPTMTSEPAVAQ
jgi:hypothetical protein